MPPSKTQRQPPHLIQINLATNSRKETRQFSRNVGNSDRTPDLYKNFPDFPAVIMSVSAGMSPCEMTLAITYLFLKSHFVICFYSFYSLLPLEIFGYMIDTH